MTSHFKLYQTVKIDGVEFAPNIYPVAEIDAGRQVSIVNAGWGCYCDAPKSKAKTRTEDDDDLDPAQTDLGKTDSKPIDQDKSDEPKKPVASRSRSRAKAKPARSRAKAK